MFDTDKVKISDQSCKGNVLFTFGYPGKSSLGAGGKNVVAFACT